MAKLMRHQNGVFYIYVSRLEKFSLKTKDAESAQKMFDLISTELQIVDIYQEVLIRYDKVLSGIREHHKSIGNFLKMKKPTYDKPFVTETGLEDFVYDHLSELQIIPVGRQIRIKNGVVDIMGLKQGNKIAVEIKLGSLSEQNLGQCLRYLNVSDITEVYLIGESISGSLHVFKEFKIRVFTVRKNRYKGKNVFIECKILQ
jgi:hypothetical protein